VGVSRARPHFRSATIGRGCVPGTTLPSADRASRRGHAPATGSRRRPRAASFAHRADCRLRRARCAGQCPPAGMGPAISAGGYDGAQTITICPSHNCSLSMIAAQQRKLVCLRKIPLSRRSNSAALRETGFCSSASFREKSKPRIRHSRTTSSSPLLFQMAK